MFFFERFLLQANLTNCKASDFEHEIVMIGGQINSWGFGGGDERNQQHQRANTELLHVKNSVLAIRPQRGRGSVPDLGFGGVALMIKTWMVPEARKGGKAIKTASQHGHAFASALAM